LFGRGPIGWIVFTIGFVVLTGVPPLPPPATALVAARVVAVSVTATARADMMFMRAVMVLSMVHSWAHALSLAQH
jgi:hypothetical protein